MRGLSLLLLWLLALSGCSPGQKTKPLGRLKVGVIEIPVYPIIFLADQRGWFAEEGLPVDFRVFESGRDGLEAALRGEVDITCVYTTPFVFQALAGADVAAISTVHRATGLARVVTRPGTDIQSVEDLRGRRVGVTPRTSAQLALEVLTAEAGVDLSQLQLVHADQKALVQLLASGQVDAASLWPPHLFNALDRLGPEAGQLWSRAYWEMSVLAGARAQVLARRPELIAFLRALRRAQVALEEDPGLFDQTIARRLPALSPESRRTVGERARFELGLSNLLLATLRLEAAWLERSGTPRHVNTSLRSTLLPRLVEQVSPELVTLPELAAGDAP